MYQGLKHSEAQESLRVHGYNELLSAKPKTLGAIVLDVVREPMFILLLTAGTIYMMLGEYSEGFVLLSWVFIIIYITFYQHRKTERSLELLRQLSSPRALVIREGKIERIAGRDLVPGDIFILNEGDRVPADATLLESHHLLVDESLLTGESIPVIKSAELQSNIMYSGTMVVSGSCVARTDTTGMKTKFGKIGASLESINKTKTRLQVEMNKLIRNLFIAGLLISIGVVVAFFLTRGNFLQSLLNGLAASMALLPEEFPVVFTIFLALGAWRLSKNNVLTREPSSIETLGAATVLCSDKTGTITQNKMSVTKLWDGAREFDLSRHQGLDEFRALLRILYYASSENPIDPMEQAIAECYLPDREQPKIELLKEFNLSNELFAMTRILKLGSQQPVAFCKGAPEDVLALCRMTQREKVVQLDRLAEFAKHGFRILAFATSKFINDTLPTEQREIEFTFGGLVCFEDPIRPEVPQSIAECYKAGIKVIMITGDYPVTASSIASQIGLSTPEHVVTGAEIECMSDDELRTVIKTSSVFARIVPEQKMRIVRSLKANGHVVAMTGDGINDAPALKAADIGISMGKKGTDVAREASSLVLLDDRFTSIVDAIRAGRRIYDNLEKAMAYIIAIHIPIIGLVLLPGFIPALPILLMPLHIVFMELIIDPACSIAFESEQEEEGIMQRPPRDLDNQFFGWRSILTSMFKGLLLFGTVVSVLYYTLHEGHSPEEVRTISFSTLIIGNLIMITHSLSDTRSFIAVIRENNKALILIALLAMGILLLIQTIPFLQQIFSMGYVGIHHFTTAAVAALLMLIILESFKFLHRVQVK